MNLKPCLPIAINCVAVVAVAPAKVKPVSADFDAVVVPIVVSPRTGKASFDLASGTAAIAIESVPVVAIVCRGTRT